MPFTIGSQIWSIEVVHGYLFYNGAEYIAIAHPDRHVIQVTDSATRQEQLEAVVDAAVKVRERQAPDALNVLLGQPSALNRPIVLLRREKNPPQRPPRESETG